MRYKLLGKSGLRVSELSLGTMTFGEDLVWGSNQEESRRIFDLYAEAGGNFLDTANVYTNGTSEKYVGEFVGKERARWVIATKYTLNNQARDVNLCGNHRKNLMQSVEQSLKRLNTDYIDLLWLHIWDYTTPIEEVMRGLDDLVQQGKVYYIGISDTPAWVVSASNVLTELRGWTSFVALQVEYSLKERTPERDLIPMANHYGMTITPWAPLAAGLLTGKYNQKKEGEKGRLADKLGERLTEKNYKIAQTVMEIAQEIGRSPAQVALNWLLQKGKNIIPIIGARKVEQVKDNLNCIDFSLSADHIQRLDKVSAIELGFPYDFFHGKGVQDSVFGGTLGKIDFV